VVEEFDFKKDGFEELGMNIRGHDNCEGREEDMLEVVRVDW
jgi:hypothetical protein